MNLREPSTIAAVSKLNISSVPDGTVIKISPEGFYPVVYFIAMLKEHLLGKDEMKAASGETAGRQDRYHTLKDADRLTANIFLTGLE